MSKLVRDLWAYFVASFWRWWLGIMLAVVAMVGLAEWLISKTILIPLWAKIALAVVALIMAPFFAWRDLHDKRRDLQNRYTSLQQQLSAPMPMARAWQQDKMDKVADFMNRGRIFQGLVPRGIVPIARIDNWINIIRNWIKETHAFLSKDCTSQAAAEFLNDAGARDVSYPGVPGKAQPWLRTLNRRLENLSKIMGSPDVYL